MAEFIRFKYKKTEMVVNVKYLIAAACDHDNEVAVLTVENPTKTGVQRFKLSGKNALRVMEQIEELEEK